MRSRLVMEPDFVLRGAESGGMSRSFRVYVPPSYDERVGAPAVLFLHGAGERGADSMAPTRVGLGRTLGERELQFAAITVFPQCPREIPWSAPDAQAIAIAALEAVEDEFRVDIARVALTGISMGAAGAWVLAGDYPERFVALAPICGWVSSRKDRKQLIRNVSRIPTWIFHGSADDIVPVDASRSMAADLRDAGSDVRYTELEGVGHNSWDAAYGSSALLDWMLDPIAR